MKYWRYIVSAIAVVLFSLFCLQTCPVQAAERIIVGEKMELWRHIDVVDGFTIVCYYPRNPKLLSNKITTGVSCVVLKPIIVYQCNDSNHEHSQYQRREVPLF